jgi:hypothetical protein
MIVFGTIVDQLGIILQVRRDKVFSMTPFGGAKNATFCAICI